MATSSLQSESVCATYLEGIVHDIGLAAELLDASIRAMPNSLEHGAPFAGVSRLLHLLADKVDADALAARLNR